MKRFIGFTALVLVALAGLPAGAQAPTVKRNILQRADLSVAGREGVIALAELPQGGEIPRHTHPGEEISYVLEGSLVLEVEGKAPVTLKAGDAFIVEAGKVHGGRAAGASAVKVVATYIVEKGQPLATPAR